MKHFYILFLFICTMGFAQIATNSDIRDNSGIQKNSMKPMEIKIYPNPVTSNYFYVSTQEMMSVKIFDILGKLVSQTEISALKNEVNVSNLNKGVYLVNLKSGKKSTTRKLIIQ